MRVVGLVCRDVLGRDHGIKWFRQAALRERDQVAIAVGQERQLPTVCVKRAKGRADVWKNGPVRQRRRERGGVIVLEVELQLGRRASQRLGEHDAVAPKRFLFLDFSLDLDVGAELLRAYIEIDAEVEQEKPDRQSTRLNR